MANAPSSCSWRRDLNINHKSTFFPIMRHSVILSLEPLKSSRHYMRWRLLYGKVQENKDHAHHRVANHSHSHVSTDSCFWFGNDGIDRSSRRCLSDTIGPMAKQCGTLQMLWMSQSKIPNDTPTRNHASILPREWSGLRIGVILPCDISLIL